MLRADDRFAGERMIRRIEGASGILHIERLPVIGGERPR
jgi:hypothetical protein